MALRTTLAWLLLALTLCPASAGAAPREAAMTHDLPRLATLHDQDQRDREGASMDWEAVAKRDEARRREVLRIIRQGRLRTANDHFRAALIFQHGEALEDYLQAFALARMALAIDPRHPSAGWLAAASWDRALLARQKTQWYGTQFELDEPSGTLSLSPVAEGAVSDDERRRLGVPALAESKARQRRISTTSR